MTPRFLPADALWNLAMAINVYLTIFRKFTGERLKKLEWIYLTICYGFTFITALVCLFISTPSRGSIYGANILWCSIGIEWAFLRVALVYGPAWVCLAVSLCIYTIAGVELFKRRAQLMRFRSPGPQSHDQDSVSAENLVTDYKTLQIQITSEPVATLPDRGQSYDSEHTTESRAAITPSPIPREICHPKVVTTINSTPLGSRPQLISVSSQNESKMGPQRPKSRRSNSEFNRAAFGYTKVALLFFFCMLITWVPASVNRFYSFLHPHQVNVPSSYVTSVVLPLMGFWNSLIYVVTSRQAVQNLFKGVLRNPRAVQDHNRRGDVESTSRMRSVSRSDEF